MSGPRWASSLSLLMKSEEKTWVKKPASGTQQQRPLESLKRVWERAGRRQLLQRERLQRDLRGVAGKNGGEIKLYRRSILTHLLSLVLFCAQAEDESRQSKAALSAKMGRAKKVMTLSFFYHLWLPLIIRPWKSRRSRFLLTF